MKELAIFVNTCDGFEDCWEPFFKLFTKYGDNLTKCKIYLNTEKKVFNFPGLDIVSLQVSAGSSSSLTWSECLAKGLDRIEEPFVLYLQEDYFIDELVAIDEIITALDFIKKNNAKAVYLNRYGPIFDVPEVDDSIVPVPASAKYLLSTQACIWNKSFLQSTILPWENGWMFEKFGGLRIQKNQVVGIFSISPKVFTNKTQVFNYIYTGVMKGKWHSKCVSLFLLENIDVDFKVRGFYIERSGLKSKLEVLQKLFSNPVNAFKSLMRSL